MLVLVAGFVLVAGPRRMRRLLYLWMTTSMNFARRGLPALQLRGCYTVWCLCRRQCARGSAHGQQELGAKETREHYGC
jgi:hypothetical protein